MSPAQTFIQQALERVAEIEKQLAHADPHSIDWPLVRGTGASLRRNLESAAAALEPAAPSGEGTTAGPQP